MLSIIKLRLLGLRDDFAVIVLMTVMALGFTAIFGISFDHFKPTVLVVDEDKSSYSEALISELKDDRGLNFEVLDMKGAEAKVEEGKAIAALIIPEGFDESIKSGEKASLGVLKVKDDILIFTMQKVVSGIVLKMAGGERIADITADFIHTLKPEAGQAVKASAYRSVMEAWEYKRPLEV
ncbi:MAG TPA: ABC transporter permease, partial [Candidatus Diapherotrites archaeon]|nr:ABC transporter permease [Candidatus Diapherotrites archaeon]